MWWRNPPANPDRGVRGEGSTRAGSEAERRARRQVRRYCVRNGLDRLMTLSYAPEHLPESWQDCWADIEDFRRKLYAHLGGPVPLVATIERGSLHDRLHVHIAFGRYLDADAVAGLWGRGFVDLRRISVAGVGKRERCRTAAAYVAKYVTKGSELDANGREFNGRRYSTSHGFAATRRSQAVSSFLDGLELAHQWVGGSVVWSWSSSDDPDWLGPPVTCLHFGDP